MALITRFASGMSASFFIFLQLGYKLLEPILAYLIRLSWLRCGLLLQSSLASPWFFRDTDIVGQGVRTEMGWSGGNV